MQKILGQLRRAVNDYKMIEQGDKIAIGISGGKDSITLLAAMSAFKRFSPQSFELCAINIDMGFKDVDSQEVENCKAFCESIGVPLIIEKTDIAQIIFEARKEKNPCSLCSKMRRGALNNAARREGCNKIALGHHADDVVETFFLSMLFEGRFSTFSPVTYLDKSDITLIRPFIYVNESDIKGAINKFNYPVIFNPCPQDKHTKRQEVKDLIKELNGKFSDARELVLSAIYHPERNNLWDKF